MKNYLQNFRKIRGKRHFGLPRNFGATFTMTFTATLATILVVRFAGNFAAIFFASFAATISATFAARFTVRITLDFAGSITATLPCYYRKLCRDCCSWFCREFYCNFDTVTVLVDYAFLLVDLALLALLICLLEGATAMALFSERHPMWKIPRILKISGSNRFE
jgi:hypothetical protein